jgi:Ca2+-binding RTX toxin-like protein
MEFENDQLTEEEFAYYAQDTEGNVWLLGESSTEYEYDDGGNLLEVESEASEAGVDEFSPGFIMLGNPQVGDTYYQEFSEGEEEEKAEVVSINESVSTPVGNFDNVLQIQEFSDIDPEGLEQSYYAPSLGLVREQEFDENGALESTSVLIETRNNVNGIEDGFVPPERVVGSARNDVFDAATTPGFERTRKLFLTGKGDDVVDMSTDNSGIRSLNMGNRVNGGPGNDELIGGRGDILSGGPGDDILNGARGAGNNRMIGGAGNDNFLLGSGDRAIGGQGNDSFFVTSGGDNVMTGGQGRDRFWIANGELPETANIITDFKRGADLLGMSGLGLSFDDLTLTQRNGNAIISVSGEEVAILRGMQASGLSESNFTFT